MRANVLLERLEDSDFKDEESATTKKNWDSHSATYVDKMLKDTQPVIATAKGETGKKDLRRVAWADEEDTSELSDGEDILTDYVLGTTDGMDGDYDGYMDAVPPHHRRRLIVVVETLGGKG